jgi:hypothetical protein
MLFSIHGKIQIKNQKKLNNTNFTNWHKLNWAFEKVNFVEFNFVS